MKGLSAVFDWERGVLMNLNDVPGIVGVQLALCKDTERRGRSLKDNATDHLNECISVF
jgi:hypothetical protein